MPTEEGDETFESYTCSVANVADAFDQNGPDEGNSLFFYNYYGKNRLVDSEGLYNELNLEDRIPLLDDQVWRNDVKNTKLIRKSGGTDAFFICTAIRKFNEPASHIQFKVGAEIDWI